MHRWLKSLSLEYLAPYLLRKRHNLGSVLLLSAEELDDMAEDAQLVKTVKDEMLSIIRHSNQSEPQPGDRTHGRVHPGDETQAASDKVRHDMDILRAAVSKAGQKHIVATSTEDERLREGVFTRHGYESPTGRTLAQLSPPARAMTPSPGRVNLDWAPGRSPQRRDRSDSVTSTGSASSRGGDTTP